MSSLLTLNYFTPFPSFPVADFKEVNICGESYLVLSSLDICFNVSTRGRQDLTRSNVWHSVIFLISHTQWCNLSKPSITQIIFFYIRVFFHGHLQFIGQQGKREHHLLFHFSTLPLFHSNIQTFVLQLCTSDDSLISNRSACIYQAATRWDLPPYRITIWLIDDVMLIFVCLFVDLIQGFCYSYLILETGGFELTSTIILVLQANRLNKCASHPKVSSKEHWKVCTNATTNFWGQKNKAG